MSVFTSEVGVLGELLASFRMKTEGLKTLNDIVKDEIYFYLTNNEVKLIEISLIHRRMGLIHDILQYKLHFDEQTEAMNELRNHKFSTNKLKYFLRRVEHEYILVEIYDEHIRFTDIANEQRFNEQSVQVFKPQPVYDRMLNFSTYNGFVITEYMKKNKNYLIIGGKEGKYINNGYPTEKLEWDFSFSADKVNLKEVRYGIDGVLSDVFSMPYIANELNLDVKGVLKTKMYYKNFNEYLSSRETEHFALVFANSKTFLPFFLYKDDNISTITTIQQQEV